jgi:hypothetical protein
MANPLRSSRVPHPPQVSIHAHALYLGGGFGRASTMGLPSWFVPTWTYVNRLVQSTAGIGAPLSAGL